MSSQSPFYSQDVPLGDDMDAWFCMLNSMVNFLSAASTLATKLEQNYLLSNVTQLKRPRFPLICAPPQCKETTEDSVEISVKEVVSESTTGDVCSVLTEEISVSQLQPESEYQGETSELMQEVRYMNTQEKGDGASVDLQEEDNGNGSAEQSVADDIQDTSCGDQPEETIKICDSEDTVFFDDFTDSDQTVDSLNLKKPLEEIADISASQAPSVEQDEYVSSSCFVEHKSVQAKCKNASMSGTTLTSKGKSIKSEEIQTHSTSRFKSTVRALITKSPELQQSIRDSIIPHRPITDEKTPGKVDNCKEKTCRIPKNLNELKEQLDSINVSNSKVTLNGNKKKPQKSSKIPVDKTTSRKVKNAEKQSSNLVVTSACSSNIPLKSPGTSKRFASIESVVKKLIHSNKTVERSVEETKESKKICAALQRKVNKQEKPEENKQCPTKVTDEHIEEKVHPLKDCKMVKKHQDFIYKKNIVSKPEKLQSLTDQSRPSSKRDCSRKMNEVSTPLSRNQSKTMSLRSLKNSSTVEMLKKKEKCCKRPATPNKPIREKNDAMTADVHNSV